MIKETFAREIKRLRVARGWIQDEAAKFCGVSVHTWLKWEKATCETHEVAMEGVLARLDPRRALEAFNRAAKDIQWDKVSASERAAWLTLFELADSSIDILTKAK